MNLPASTGFFACQADVSIRGRKFIAAPALALRVRGRQDEAISHRCALHPSDPARGRSFQRAPVRRATGRAQNARAGPARCCSCRHCLAECPAAASAWPDTIRAPKLFRPQVFQGGPTQRPCPGDIRQVAGASRAGRTAAGWHNHPPPSTWFYQARDDCRIRSCQRARFTPHCRCEFALGQIMCDCGRGN